MVGDIPDTGLVSGARIAPVRAEFTDAGLERLFQDHQHAQNRNTLRLAMLSAAVGIPLTAIVQILIEGASPASTTSLAVAAAFAIIATACAELLGRKPGQLGTRIIAVAVLGASVAVLLWDIWARPGQFSALGMTFCIPVFAAYVFVPSRIVTSTLLAVATIVGVEAVLVARAAPANELFTIGAVLAAATFMGFLVANIVRHSARQAFRAQLELRQLSVRDHLTGCFNRRYLVDTLIPQELAHARSTGLPLSAVMVDLDNFKQINDIHGHRFGDEVLVAFAALLGDRAKSLPRAGVVRHGGEEFLIVLPETDLAVAAAFAEDLRVRFAGQRMETVGADLIATASFGVASLNEIEASNEDAGMALLDKADARLYAAKLAGRNRVCSCDGKPSLKLAAR
jgi:diguanylate cyclase (GGDEF)-like protein